MSTGRPDPAAVRQLMKLAGVSPGGGATDRELVERFVMDRSESAFADLMARHGPMVLAVCKRHLRDPHAAEDAFQAVFIVLARRAGAVKWRESVGGWLFEVASRVAKKAATQTARRASREGARAESAPEPEAPPPPPPATADLTALQAALDDELRNLPEKFRAPVVLCHLEGLSQDEVAKHLGISDGQLRGRLYRAKERLRERLLRRGFGLAAVLLALGMGGAAQAVPAVLAAGTLRLACSSPQAVPVAVQLLATGVIRDMGTSFKALAAVAVLSAIGLAAAGFAARSAFADAPNLGQSAPPAPLRAERLAPLPPVPKFAQPARADDDKKPDEKLSRVGGWVKAADAAKGTLTVKLDEGGQETALDVAAGAKVLFAGKAVKLDDLKSGMRADLFFPPEPAVAKAVEVRAQWPSQKVKVRALDPAKGSLTFALGGDGGVDFPVTIEVVKGAKVTVDGLAAGLADLPLSGEVQLHLNIDKTAVLELEADGAAGDLPALVKKYDAAAQTLLVEFAAEANDRGRTVTLCLPVNATAKVRLAGSDAKLTDLQERMPVRLKMTADRKAIAGVLAGHPLPPEKDDDE